MCEPESCPDPPSLSVLCSTVPKPERPQISSHNCIFLVLLRKGSRRGNAQDLEILPLPLSCFGIPENKKHRRNGRHYSNDGDKFN